MKIAIIAAGLALAGGLGAAAPAEAQYNGGYGHDAGHNGGGYHGGGYHGGGYVRGGYGHGGYGYRHYGYRGYGPRYGYHHRRVICTYHHGFRRCFRPY
ncbi:hypothetical protein [uncultured Sphingomonas sp.]|uniref:hypothetical protein n=1 Tax=uncultured Sphingomonas sp. TaxID=158754 RepID=UPI0035CA980C